MSNEKNMGHRLIPKSQKVREKSSKNRTGLLQIYISYNLKTTTTTTTTCCGFDDRISSMHCGFKWTSPLKPKFSTLIKM